MPAFIPIAIGAASAIPIIDLLYGGTIGRSKNTLRGLAGASSLATDFILPQSRRAIDSEIDSDFLGGLLDSQEDLDLFQRRDAVSATAGQSAIDIASISMQIANIASKSVPSNAEIMATLRSYTSVF